MNALIAPLIILVNQIPYGRVVSYGRLAQQLNIITDTTTSGWMVGRMLTSLSQKDRELLPRQRVINKQGYISTLKLGAKGLEQIRLLLGEGVIINEEGYIDMKIYEWSWPREDLFFE